jgi:hypothetical protein
MESSGVENDVSPAVLDGCWRDIASLTGVGGSCTRTDTEIRQAYSFGVDAFTQQRVMRLRNETASLQHENESYRSQSRHTPEQKDSHDLRGFRLQAIREELIKMTAPFPGGQAIKLIKSQRLSQPKNNN